MLGVADGGDGALKLAPIGWVALGALAGGFGVAVAVGGLGASEVFGVAGLGIGAAVFMVLRG
jgi:hypothetical protein